MPSLLGFCPGHSPGGGRHVARGNADMDVRPERSCPCGIAEALAPDQPTAHAQGDCMRGSRSVTSASLTTDLHPFLSNYRIVVATQASFRTLAGHRQRAHPGDADHEPNEPRFPRVPGARAALGRRLARRLVVFPRAGCARWGRLAILVCMGQLAAYSETVTACQRASQHDDGIVSIVLI